jgi:phage terminase large subunit
VEIHKFSVKGTPVLERLMQATEPIVISRGGTRSSKSFSIDQMHVIHAWNEKRQIAKVARYRAWIKDQNWMTTLRILDDWEMTPHCKINHSDLVIEYPKGSLEYFMGMDVVERAKGRGWNEVHLEEGNLLPKGAFDEFWMRMSEPGGHNRLDISFNPTEEFWVKTDIMDNPGWSGKWREFISTYQDNPFLPAEYIANLKLRAERDENFRRVYMEGQWGRLEGRIIKDVDFQAWPETITHSCIGLDFGYSVDPAAVVRVGWDRRKPNDLYLQELVYSTGLSNAALSAAMDAARVSKHEYVVADSAEPKSIDEFKGFGWSMYPSEKGADSVRFGMDLVGRFNVHCTPDSRNAYSEAQGWHRKTDRDGKVTPFEGACENHIMSAVRYALEYLRPYMSTGEGVMASGIKRSERNLCLI